MTETSTKPYLIRAIHEWCVDNGYTPYLAVAVNANTQVPPAHVKAGEIVLNVSPLATQGLQMGNEFIEFQARFGGVAQQISVPVAQVHAIYARENGQGMAFEVSKELGIPPDESLGVDTHSDQPDGRSVTQDDGPSLVPVGGAESSSPQARSVLSSVSSTETKGSDNQGDAPRMEPESGASKPSQKDEKKSKSKRKNHLTRVK